MNQWDPNQLPGPNDTANHGTQASGVMTYDDQVEEPNRTISNLLAVAGDSRGLVIDEGLDLTITSNFTRSGTGSYQTELLLNSILDVQGTISQGNWMVGSGAQVVGGNIALGSNTEWTLNGGIVDVTGGLTSTSSDNDFTINSAGLLTVGGSATFFDLFVNAGGTADITNTLASRFRINVDGGTLSAGAPG